MNIPSPSKSPYNGATSVVPSGGVPSTESLFSGLDNARQLVESAILRDSKYPELWDLLSGTSSGAGDYSVHDASNFYQSSSICLPDTLLAQYSHLECKCFMGMFPEINRAWLTIDNAIYLWNCNDGSDVCYYDGLGQIIVSAGLIKPKSGIFNDQIEFLLCLATPVEIVILGIGFSEASRPFGPKDSKYAEMELVPTQLSVPSDNVSMNSIVGTESGRIIMGGRDGCIYEFVYQAEDGWFSSRCSIVNLSSNLLSKFVPEFLKLSADDPIMQIVTDSTRNILYSLSEKGKIEMFDMGPNGDTMALVACCDNICGDASRFLNRGQIDKRSFRIVSIHPILATESKHLHLLAVSSSGIRVYFSGLRANVRISMGNNVGPGARIAPTCLEAVHVRTPPSLQLNDGLTNHYTFRTTTMNAVNTTYYAHGTLLLADSITEDTDVLLGISPDVTKLNVQPNNNWNQRQGPLRETTTTLKIEGKAWAICEIPTHLNIFPYMLPGCEHPCNELASQHLVPARRFVFLTNSGVHMVTKLRPVDHLKRLLLQNENLESEMLSIFVRQYGEEEVCSMCVLIACSTFNQYADSSKTTPFGDSTVAADKRLIRLAIQAYFRFGGEPYFNVQNNGNVPGSPNNSVDIGRAIATPDIVYSASHNGLCLYLSRLLSPLLKNSLVKQSNNGGRVDGRGNRGDIIESRMSLQEISWFLDRLLQVKSFMEENINVNAQYSDISRTGRPENMQNRLLEMQHRKHFEQSWKMEKVSLNNFYQLVIQSIEALCFWNVICSHNFASIVEGVSPQRLELLSMFSFLDFITSADGRDIAREIVTSLMSQFTSSDTAVDAISDILRTKSPSFFSSADSSRYKAYELLQKAKHCPNKARRLELLRESSSHHCKVSKYVDLRLVCDQYQFLRFYEGIIDLVLAHTQEIDSHFLGIQYFRDNENPDDVNGKALFDSRMLCYDYIFTALDELFNISLSRSLERAADRPEITPEENEKLRREAVQKIIASDDELCHIALYRWFIDRGLYHQLLELDSQYIEIYLKHEFDRTGNNEALDLLWQYYVRNDNYGAAAKILSQLAEKRGCEIPLSKRVEYLSLAVSNAKSCPPRTAGGTDGELLHELEEKMEVAYIQQKVYNELRNIHDRMRNTSANNSVGSQEALGEFDVAELEQALSDLESGLCELSELYNAYAQHFKLHESCLAILHCANYNDPGLVIQFWDQIIKEELSSVKARGCTPAAVIKNLSSKVSTVGRLYYPSEVMFPIRYLCSTLECQGFHFLSTNNYVNLKWVYKCFLDVGVPYATIYDVYNQTFRAKETFWQNPRSQLYFLNVLRAIITEWMDVAQESEYGGNRMSFRMAAVEIEGSIGNFLVDLQSAPSASLMPPSYGTTNVILADGDVVASTAQLIEAFKNVRSRLLNFA
eukprot:Nk52_evm1s262 gene=Nk52_evmTU1s262